MNRYLLSEPVCYGWRILLAALFLLFTLGAARGVTLVQEFYLPIPEWEVLQACKSVTPSIADTNFASITAILVTGDGTQIFYDQWEDGYEPNLSSPTNASTLIWGDGIDTNGIPPGFVHDPAGLAAGTVLILSNAVASSPRIQSQIVYDGRDRIAATKALVVTRAGWPNPTGPVFGGSAVVQATIDWGTNYVSPIGQDMTENLFKFCGFFVMASQDNTVAVIDPDGPGPLLATTNVLGRGQSWYYPGGVRRGGTINASKPVEAHLVCGDTVSTYAIDWFTLYPQSDWSSSYYTPVPSVQRGGTLYLTDLYFYNNTATPITIQYTNQTATNSFTLPANGGYKFIMPTNSGAVFASAGGEQFTVLCTVANSSTDDTSYNWGFTPLPKGSLTTEADAGWSPGSSDYTGNGSPVWVTPTAATRIYVDYRGDHAGLLTDPNGGKYDTNFTLVNYQSQRIYVPGTNDQTGLRIYTLDGTLLSVVWGEDPSVAGSGNPYLDLGNPVLPFPVPRLTKSAIILTDAPPAGLSVGDTLLYTVQVDNKGLLPLGNTVVVDAPPPALNYLTNSATLNGSPVPDSTNGTAFPLDTPGYTIPIILSGGTTIFQYKASIVATGSVVNTVNIPGYNVNVTNTVPVAAVAPSFFVGKTIITPASGVVGVGQTMQFNLQIINNGNVSLPNVAITDNYPATNFSYVTASLTPNSAGNGQILWTNLGTFAVGQVTNITVTLLATNTAAIATNTVIAVSPGNTTNFASVVFTNIAAPTPSVVVNKTLLAPATPKAGLGQAVQFNLQAYNNGFATLTNLSLTDNFPRTNFTFVSASVVPNLITASNLVWTNLGNFSPGQLTNIVVNFTVTNYSALVTNYGVAAAVGGATNIGSSSLQISRSGLSISKTVLSPTNQTVPLGSNVTFRILIQNSGQLAITNLPLEDTFSSSLFSYVSATIPPSSIAPGSLFWTNLAGASGMATNVVITNDVTLRVTGGGTPAYNNVAANFAFDVNNTAVAPASSSVGVNTAAGSISGKVYSDNDQSGTLTGSDTPLENVTLSLYSDPNGDGNPADGVLLQSIGSDANGYYELLNLNTGAFVVVQTVLPGYTGTAPANNRLAVLISSLTATTNQNFFQYQVPAASYATVNGTVWSDVNGVGFYQAGDFGQTNVQVDLVQDLNTNGIVDAGETPVQSTFTLTNGTYNFSAVAPGRYIIREVDSPGYISTGDTRGTNDNQIAVNLGNGVTTNGNDFFDFYFGLGNTNSPPVAVPDFTNMLENVALVVTPLVNDNSPGGYTLFISNVAATNGTASVLGGTNILFMPANYFIGTATIGYTVTNANGASTSLITITVAPVADLGIAKTGPASVLAVSNLTYSLSVTNFGPAAASSVTVTDVLPSGVTFVSASGNGANNSGLVTWSIATLSSNQVTNVTVTVTAPASGTLTNIASVGSPTTETNTPNNLTPPVVTTVTPLADLVIAKTGAASVIAGSSFSYTISVTNLGPSSASSVTVTDALPGGLTFSNATAGGTNLGGNVVWNLGTLTALQSTNFTLTVIAPTTGVTLTNVARVSSPTGDTNVFNNTNPPVITTVLAQADVSVVKIGPAGIIFGTNYDYTITVSNGGPSTATSLIVTDSLPIGLTFVSSIPSATTNASNQVVWNLGNFAANTASNLTLTVISTQRGSLTNFASGGSPTPDPTPTNNVTPPVVTLVTNFPPLANPDSASMTENTTSTLTPLVNDVLRTPGGSLAIISFSATNGVANLIGGTNFSFTPTVNFIGTATIGYTITDNVGGTNSSVITISVTNIPPLANPDGYTVFQNSTNTFAPLTNDIVRTFGGTLTIISVSPTNGTATISGTNIIFTPTPGFTGTATIGYAITDGIGGTNSTVIAVNVQALAEIVVSKTGAASVYAATNFDYTISVTNFGPGAAVNLSVTDNLPSTVSFVSASAGGTFNAGQVIWANLGSLAANAATNLTVTVTAPLTSQTLTNFASGGSPTSDPNPTNNTSPPVTTTVTPVVNLAIGKVGPATVLAVSNLTYTISVTNFGPSSASSVTVTDALPAGVTFVSATGGGATNGNLVTWSLGTLTSNQISSVSVTVTAPASGSLTNVASVGTPTLDPTPTNNITPPVITTVTPLADLVIAKTGPASVSAAITFSYTISVTNFGPSSASSVMVTDTLPIGITFSNASAGGVNVGGSVVWNLGTMTASQATNLTLTVIAPNNGTTLTNVANVSSPTGDTNVLNNTTPPVVTSVTPVADVSVFKTGPAGIVFGTNYNYSITVSNGGPSTATSLIMTDSLPVGLVFVSSVPSATTNASNQVIWNPGSLSANTASNLTLTVISTQRGSLTNFASGGSPTPDPTPTNNVTPPVVTLVTNFPPLANPDGYAVLENSTNTFSPLTNDVVRNPGGVLSIISVMPTNGTATISGTNVIFTPTNNFIGTATIGYTITDGVGGTNSSVITVTVLAVADIAVSKTGAASVYAATNFDYTITVTNFGPGAAANLSVTDSLPSAVSFVSASAGGVFSAGQVIWASLGSLAENAATNLTVTVTAPLTSQTLTNIATTGTPTSDPNPTNNVTPPVTTTVTPIANVAIGKVGPATVFAVSNLTYTIFVTNFGPSAASSVMVTDALPNGVTFVSTTGSGVTNGSIVSWNLGTLSSNQVTNVTVTVTAPASGSLTNIASVSTPTLDPTPTNNITPPVITTVTLLADVSITKSAPASVLPGTNFIYTIVVTNSGPSTAANLSVTDSLPLNVNFVSATAGFTVSGSQLIWTNLGSLAANSATNLSVTVTAPVRGGITNTASAGSPTSDPTPTNNFTPPVTTTVLNVAPVAANDFASTPVNVAVTMFPLVNDTDTNGDALFITAVSATNGAASFTTNSVLLTPTANFLGVATVGYTISDGNGGTASAIIFISVTNRPPVANNDSASGTNGFAQTILPLGNDTDPDGDALTITSATTTNGIVSINGGATSLAFTPTNGSTTINYTISDGRGGSASAVITVNASSVADLVIAKTAAASVNATTNFSYTISVTNFGPSSASSVTVTDALPIGVKFVSASGNGATNGGNVIWTLGTLTASQATNLTLAVTAPASGSLTNFASIGSPTTDPVPTNNVTPPVITTVTPLADVQIGKIGPATVFAASNLTYTITVTNFGPSSASSVVVTDALPSGVTFVSATGGGVTNGGIVSWNLGTLTSNQISSVSVTVTAPPSGSLTNTASVSTPTSDPNPTNNVTSPVITTVTPLADVSVVKIGPAGIIFGTNYDYTITVSNGGPSTASSLIVTDSLPVGLAFVSSVPSTTTNASNQVIWNLGSLLANTASNLTLTVISTQLGSLTNIASGGSPTPDPTPTNNVTPPVVTLVTNFPPLANPDSASMSENTTNTVSPLINDSVRTPGGTLTILSVTPTNGTASISGTNVIFVPTLNFTGITTIGYTITDNVGGTNSSVITVTVTNIPPIANPDSYAMAENTTNTFSPLVNDTLRTLGGTLSLVSLNPTNGTASISGTNVIFTPTLNFLGTATIGYTITDGIGGTNSSLITISVTNRPPVANPDTYAMTENTTNSLPVLVNDVVITPGGTLTIISVMLTNGTASINGTNISFVPTLNFLGTATIGYTITDGIGGTNSSVATVTITNIPPLANPDAFSMAENSTNTFSPLGNDVVRTPGGVLSLISVSPTNGAASIIGGTNVTFIPTINFVGVTTIGYTITDGIGGTNSSVTIVTVTNQSPIAFPQTLSTTENTALPVTLTGFDPVGRPLTFISVSSPGGGTLTSLNTNTGAVTYTPTNNFTGTDTFVFRVNNGVNNSSNATVTISVTPTADLLVRQSGPVSGIAGSNLVFTVAVTNLGPASATNIVVTNQIDSGWTFVSATADGNTNGNLVTWTIPVLPANGKTNLTVTLLAMEGGTFTNIASGDNVTPDLNSTNNNGSLTNAQVVTTVSASANLAVTKSTPASVNAAGSLTYTISVTNGGPSTATGVIVTDALPASVAFVTASGNGVNNSGIVTWNLGALANGATSNLTVTVTAPASGSLTNIASIGSPTPDPTPINNVTPPVITTVTTLADLAIGKSGTAAGALNANFSYTISVTNLGPSTAANFTVTDSLPAGIVFVSAVPSVTTNASSQVIWTNLGTLALNATTNLMLTVKAVSRGTVTNIAMVGGPTIDPTPTNNTSAPVVTSITNRPPVAVDDSGSTARNVPVTIPVLLNDSDPDGDTLTIVSVNPTNGTFSISGTNIIFTPTNATPGTDVIGYTITDGFGGTNSALVIITVTNRAPVAVNDSGSTSRNAPVSIPVLANDSDPDGDALTIISASVTNGTFSIVGMNIVFTPTNAAPGTNIFSYTITDGFGGTNAALVTVTVTNRPPVATDDSASTARNVPVTIPVLVNDSDPDGDTLTIVSVSPTNGIASIVGTNIVFTPTNAAPGTNVIGYRITDGFGGTNFALITIAVTNRPPVAVNDSASTAKNVVVTIPALFNDTDPDGDALTIVGVSSTNGPVIISGTNVVFTPTNNFLGLTTINYTIADAFGGTNFALITINVTNRPPMATNDFASTPKNVAVTIPVLMNDGDPDGDVVFIATVSSTNGIVAINGTNVIYTPTNNFLGVVTVSYAVTDNFGGTNSAFIFVSVTNRAPVAVNDSGSTPKNVVVTIPALANDSDPDGDALTIISVSPTNGTAIISGTNVMFTPSTNFLGTATVGYRITDGFGGTNVALITITVTNRAPVAVNDSATTPKNVAVTIPALVNDSDPDGDALTIISVAATNGFAVISGTNIVFTPTNNFLGTTFAGYTIRDNFGGTNFALIIITVTNRAPVAGNDSGSTPKNVAVTIPVLANDSDPDGDALTIGSVSPTNGTANIVGTNVVFTPALDFIGTAFIGYTITDGFGGTNSALITINVTNRAPVANAQSTTTPFNIAKALTLTGSDLDGDALTFVIVSSPSGGTLTGLNTNTGAVIYTSTNNFTGIDTFTFRVNDGTANSVTATVSITVGAPVIADLAVFKTGPTNGAAGLNLVYSITVTNLGTAIATNVIVSDSLPAGFIFVSATPTNTSLVGNVVNWSVFKLAANGKTNFTLTARSLEGGTFTNFATAISDAYDPNPTNNNGTLTNSQVRTTIAASADVQVFKDGGTNVAAGSTVNYTITATNAGPSTATNVVVKDNLPPGSTFQSASGSYTFSNNVVTWSALTLTNGAAVNFTLALTAPTSGQFTNIALATSPTPDPNLTNNNGSLNKSRVATKIVPVADLIVLLYGPTNAVQGSNFVYSLILSNAGPSVASNAITSDQLPTNFVFVSASSGGVFSNGVVTWPKIAMLGVGSTSNYFITVNSPFTGTFTNIASAISDTLDPNPTNNTGVAPASQALTTVSVADLSWLGGTPIFNPQTGLYEETVIVTNNGNGTIAGFWLYVTVSTNNVSLWNATGTNGGVPYVQYNSPLDPSNHISLVLEFYDPLRVPFTNTLRVVPVIPADAGSAGTNGFVSVDNIFTDTRTNGTRFVIEFSSVPGKTYTVIYSHDLLNWKVATPSVSANANVTQWYDDGPPKTESEPMSVTNRFYRVIKN